MRRQNRVTAAAFLVGMLSGVLATAGYDRAVVPADRVDHADAASGAGDPVGDEAPNSAPARAAQVVEPATAPAGAPSTAPEATGEEPELESRLQALTAGWSQVQQEVARLRGRVSGLEQRLAAASASTAAREDAVATRPRRGTSATRRTALIDAGLTEARAEDVLWRQGQQELDRLELRDIAIREGWFRSDRYREELREIRSKDIDLRAEIGEERYDRYLYAAGEDNRVEIASVIPGSRADEAGLEPGDLVESYGDDRVFTFEDLRSATSEGEREELVPLRLRRGGSAVEIWVPRGPLGVRLERVSAKPED